MEDLYEKYSKGNISAFDTNHSSFRSYAFIKFMDLREQEFIASFRFEGDDEFTKEKQRAFLKLCFRYGYSGIINVESLVRGKITSEVNEAIDILEVPLKDLVAKELGNKIPVAVLPATWDINERVFQGTGVTLAKHNIGRKTYNVSQADTAMLQFNNNGMSGYFWWFLPAYIHATGHTVIKKRLTMLDGKLVNNKVNNVNRGIQYDSVYKVDDSFLELAPTQKSMSGSENSDIDVAKMLDTKLKRLDISNGETVNDLLTFIEGYEKAIMTAQGVRTNTNEGKQERSISMDFESMEVHWRKIEKDIKDFLEIFTNDYKRIFGKELTVISLVDETIKELNEKEIEKAGRMSEATNKDKDNKKEGKDE